MSSASPFCSGVYGVEVSVKSSPPDTSPVEVQRVGKKLSLEVERRPDRGNEEGT